MQSLAVCGGEQTSLDGTIEKGKQALLTFLIDFG